jgi:hypothetical protein
MGHTLTQILQSVQVSLLTVTASLIMLIAIAGHRSMHPPHPVHFFVSIFTIATPSIKRLVNLMIEIIAGATARFFGHSYDIYFIHQKSVIPNSGIS